MGISSKLSDSRRRELAEGLFQITSRDEHRGELHGCCPLHGEKNPSFSYNYRKDRYHCFACSAGGTLARLWWLIQGISDPVEGTRAFAARFGIEHERATDRGPPEAPAESAGSLDEIFEKFPSLPDAWQKRLQEVRGWTAETIKRLDLRLQTYYLSPKDGLVHQCRKPERVAIPVRDDKGRVCNIRLYKPGAQTHKILPWGKGYGTSRLFPPAPLESTNPVLLCEGEPDTLCAISQGLNSLSQTSKTKNWPKAHLEPFRGRAVVVAYDADQAGQKYADFAAHNLQGVAASVRLLEWPDHMGRLSDGTWPKDHGQDLTDFFVKHGGTRTEFDHLVAAAKPYEPADGAACYLAFFARGANDRLAFKPRLLADKVLEEKDLLYEPDTGLTYSWNGRHWEIFPDDHVKKECLRLLGDEAQKSRVEDAAFQARVLSTIPHGRQINDMPDWVCVKNGMVNLRTMDLRPHAKSYYASYMLPVTFEPESGRVCDRWRSFLKETIQTPEPILQVQEFAGSCLSRDTRYAKSLLLIGPGQDGKSTYLKTLRKLVGPDNCSAVSFRDLEDQFLRASLYNKLLNIATEIGHQAMESPYFKAVVSGDPISAAFKHKTPFSFTPYCKLAFATNKMPRVLDNSDGFFRRVLPVHFKRQFINDADVHLEEKLEDELSEIFEWALVGLHRLMEQEKYTECEETRQLLSDYRRLNDPVTCFIEDVLTLDDERSTAKEELYSQYRAYCTVNGYNPYHRENFFRELYAALSSLKECRPWVNCGGVRKRERMIKGVGIDVAPSLT